MNEHKKLIELLDEFDTAMLVTRSPQGSLEARPMAVAEVEENGNIWFITDRHSGKVDELRMDNDVAVTMQGSNKFVALSGNASMVDDRNKLDELWSESWKVWFPEGKSSDNILLLKIDSTHGEYWDNSGATGVKYLFKAGAAYLQGERPETDASINASVSMK